LTGGLNATTINFNGTVLTAGVEYTASTSNDATAESLKDAIHALSGVSATRTNAVVNVVADAEGTAGNAITMSTTFSSNLVLSGATLSGGTDAWSCAVSGTGSTAQVTVNGTAVSTGAVGDPLGYYVLSQATTALTSSYVRFAMPFPAQKVEIVNDEPSGANQVLVSLNGTDLDATLDATESVSYSTDTSYLSVVWLKYGTDAPAYRLKAYGV
jgi:hypothetical protein